MGYVAGAIADAVGGFIRQKQGKNN